jgi:L-fuconolactonase
MEWIDAHHHLWRYTPEEYEWIENDMQALRRNFLPENLTHEMRAAGVSGSVVVQARQTMEETRSLLDLADTCEVIRGVVGWAPISNAEGFAAAMEEFAGRNKLKGLRHVVQAEPDDFLLREDFNQGISAIRGTGLVYDILIYERQLLQAIEFVDRHPEQVFVLDHIAKPVIRDGVMEPWSSLIRDLAKRQNVWCKVSGMVTEADWATWTAQSLRPYLDVVAEAFGPGRLMVGSDWPVCLVACGYRQWFDLLDEYFSEFTESEREAVFGKTAKQIYRLE